MPTHPRWEPQPAELAYTPRQERLSCGHQLHDVTLTGHDQYGRVYQARAGCACWPETESEFGLSFLGRPT